MVENVRDGQFGDPGYRRITSVWEPQRGYSPGHHHKGAGDQERTDIWYDEKSGRPIAMRAAAFDIDEEGVPYIQKPKPEKIRYIKLFKYGKTEKGEDTVQSVAVSRGQIDIDREWDNKENPTKTQLRWSEPRPIQEIRKDFILPPRK